MEISQYRYIITRKKNSEILCGSTQLSRFVPIEKVGNKVVRFYATESLVRRCPDYIDGETDIARVRLVISTESLSTLDCDCITHG